MSSSHVSIEQALAGSRLLLSHAEMLHERLEAGPSGADWVADFEQEIVASGDVAHAIALASPSVALHHILTALELQPDDEVVMPARVQLLVPDVVRHFCADVVLVDVLAESCQPDPVALCHAFSPRTRAIVVATGSVPPFDLAAVMNAAAEHGLFVIELTEGTRALNQPAAILFEHHIRCVRCDAGDGSLLRSGSVVETTSSVLARRIRHQLELLEPSSSKAASWPGQFQYADRMSEPAAAWHLIALTNAPDEWHRRCEIAMNYTASLGSLIEVEVPEESGILHPWDAYTLRLNLQHLRRSRDMLALSLRRLGVRVAATELPIHMHPMYSRLYGFTPDSFPVARNDFMRELNLPITPAMTDYQVDQTITAVRETLQH